MCLAMLRTATPRHRPSCLAAPVRVARLPVIYGCNALAAYVLKRKEPSAENPNNACVFPPNLSLSWKPVHFIVHCAREFASE